MDRGRVRREPPDSWELLEGDARGLANLAHVWRYLERRGVATGEGECATSAAALDLVRRARALAGDGRGVPSAEAEEEERWKR